MRLKVATLNIHKGLSLFNRRMVIHELREGLARLGADIVFLQEVQGLHEKNALRFGGWPQAAQHEFLAGDEWQHAYGRNAVYEHGHHGNAILSRFPIVSFDNHDVSNHRFESRGLLHCRIAVPGMDLPLDCACIHLSLDERGRRRQIEAMATHLSVPRDAPMIVAGDFNDWRHSASGAMSRRLGLEEVSVTHSGKPARTFPSIMPVLRLDRIYVRGFEVLGAQAHRGAPWRILSDHLALSAELRYPHDAEVRPR
ncbi:MAG: endonuclease/exonuclease/phosphatase family protein [Proteobacteria bacterium]|nr:endonuclease/exonuclease/phosphatase family protein [Pseudomonadota bacterium]